MACEFDAKLHDQFVVQTSHTFSTLLAGKFRPSQYIFVITLYVALDSSDQAIALCPPYKKAQGCIHQRKQFSVILS